jgi:hypothetical protein
VTDLVGPVDAEMTHIETGALYHVEIYLCGQCEHIVQMVNDAGTNMRGDDPVNCLENCKPCICNKTN